MSLNDDGVRQGKKEWGEEKTEGKTEDFNLNTPPVEIFGQHSKRVEPLLKKGIYDSSVLSTFWGRRFTFNKASEEKLLKSGTTNLSNYAKKLGIKENLLPDTLEEANARILSNQHDLSNSTIKQDNYEFFLHNSNAVALSLSKILLAKTEKDRNLKASLEDILDPKGEWADASPEVVTREVYNRLKKRNLYNIPEIQTILKVLSKIHSLKSQEEDYQKTINEQRDKVIDRLKKGYAGEIFPNINTNDDISLQDNYGNILMSLYKIVEYKDIKDSSENLASLISRIEEELIKEEYDITDEEKIDIKDTLIDFSNYIENREELHYLYNTKVTDIKENIKRALGLFSDETLKDFDELNHVAKENAIAINQNSSLILDIPPRAVLYALYNDSVFNDFKEEKADNKYISSIQKIASVDKEKATLIFNNLRDILKNNSEAVLNIVELEEQEQYNPTVFTINDKKNDPANKLLQEALALAIFKAENSEVFNEIYSPEAQRHLLYSVTDPNIINKRPEIDEVNDVFNSYLLLHKSTTSQISDKEVDEIIDSSVFKDNSVLNQNDLKNIRKFSKDLSRESEKIFADITAGMPNQDELSFAIQEMAYIDIARKQTEKLDFTPTNVGRFFRNNLAIQAFSNCMEVAKNPANNVETTPSMSKDCIKQLKDRLEQEAKLSGEVLAKAGVFAGFNPFTSLIMLQTIMSKAQADIIEREMLKATKLISEQISYVERSSDNIQKLARQLLVENNYSGASDSFVDKNIVNQISEAIKRESIAYSIVNNKPVLMKGVFKARFSDDLSINLENLTNLDSNKDALKVLTKYRKDIYESIIKTKDSNLGKHKNELLKIDRIIATVQKNILLDNNMISDTLKYKLGDEANKVADILEDIRKNGLNDNNISSLFNRIDNTDVKNNIMIFIDNTTSVVDILNNNRDDIAKSDKASSVAIYLDTIRNSGNELYNAIDEANSQFIAIDESGNKAYIQTGKGIDGYILKELQKEKNKQVEPNGEIDAERYKKLKSLTSENYHILSRQAKQYIMDKTKSIETANRERLRSTQQKQRERGTSSSPGI